LGLVREGRQHHLSLLTMPSARIAYDLRHSFEKKW
jgi:hypothetical protein